LAQKTFLKCKPCNESNKQDNKKEARYWLRSFPFYAGKEVKGKVDFHWKAGLHVFADPLDHQYGNKQNVSIDVISIASLCIANKFKLNQCK
jgi:hypothetical protein